MILLLGSLGCVGGIFLIVWGMYLWGGRPGSLAHNLIRVQIVPSKDGPSQRKEAIKVLTHNVWGHYIVPAPFREKRADLLAGAISSESYDIVLLQEAFLMQLGPFSFTNVVNILIDNLAKAGLMYHTDPLESYVTNRGFLKKVQNSGLITFSRHPIESSSFVPFSQTEERFNNKGFEVVKIKAKKSTWITYNTHLDSRSKAVKQAQIQQVIDHLINEYKEDIKRKEKKGEEGETHFILGGDLNISTHDAGLYPLLRDQLAEIGLVDLFSEEASTFRAIPGKLSLIAEQLSLGLIRTPISEHLAPNTPIDHLFVSDRCGVVSKGLLDVRKGRLIASDHLGLQALLDDHL